MSRWRGMGGAEREGRPEERLGEVGAIVRTELKTLLNAKALINSLATNALHSSAALK